jgi:anti-anti-sigma regulatory factor
MEIKREQLEAIEIISPVGEITSTKDINALVSVFKSLDKVNLILELGSLNKISSDCLDVLTLFLTACNDIEKSFVICGVNNEIIVMISNEFEEDFFNIVPTKNEAVDMVYMEEQERELFS